MLSIRQVAARLGLTTRTVYRYITKGWLKIVRYPSGTIKVKEEDLAEFINGNHKALDK